MQQEQPYAVSTTRIILVEDNDSIADILTFILTRNGYVVDHATDGLSAERLILSSEPPFAVLMDVMLPYLDGFQLVQRIRQRQEWQHVPILMLTGESKNSEVERALAAGATDYIVKPFPPHELVARLNRLRDSSKK